MNRDNRETQLAAYHVGAGYGGPGQLAPWEQGGGMSSGGGMGASSAPPEATPLRKIHRLLRGRYVLAVFLALLGAAAGGVAGFMSQKPMFSSTGIIAISGVIPSPDHKDSVIQMYGQHLARQVSHLSGERLHKLALERPEFKNVKQFTGPEPWKEFAENLKVVQVRNTDQINVTYTDLDPAVAPLAVKAVINTYSDHFKGGDLEFVRKRTAFWEDALRDADNQIKSAKKTIAECIAESGWSTDDLSVLIKSQQEEQQHYARQSILFKQQLGILKNGKAPQLSVDDIARLDPSMASRIVRRDTLKTDLARVSLTLLPQHRSIVMFKTELIGVDQEIEQAAEEFRKKWVLNNGLMLLPGAGANGGGNNSLVPNNAEQLEELITIADKQAAENKRQAEKLGDLARRIKEAQQVITDSTDKLKRANEELDRLRFQADSVGEVMVISEGNASVLSIDHRIKVGAVGFLAGGAMPIGLMLLVGLMDRRYRYSDEPGGDVSGITLLGILPNLPDRLSDPEQAAIAAHCVHQIRTMLQINGSAIGAAGPDATEDRRVFAVTSAAPGDGKTSLTLALGLSYAACGTRTLLIDCDLVGGGLTSRMNVHATEGVLEAITDRSLLPYVRTTDIADVSILPVGAARGHHASTLSPGALRRLINEAKQNFEVILIDTGPILGSIEASLVCAAADGVVLAVARGQQRPMVEKAMGHLAAIGARLAGVVFNRAQSSDFERSISGMSMRSISRHPSGNGNGHSNGNGAGDAGPMARALSGGSKR